MAAVDGKNMMTVCDIYHIATDLRSEFERLMTTYGPEKFSLLVSPVVRSLELLECFTEAQHRDDAELDDLRNYVDLLQAEKRASAVLKEKYEKELEDCEREWKAESLELQDSANKLQHQNGKLQTLLTEHSLCREQASDKRELVMVLKHKVDTLRETMQTQRSQLRCLERDLDDRCSSIAALEQLVGRLESLNSDLWRQTGHTQAHVEQHVDDVVSLELLLKHRDKELRQLRTLEEECSRRAVDVDQQRPASSTSNEKTALSMTGESGAGSTVEDVTETGNRQEFKSDLCETLPPRSQLTLTLSHSADSLPDGRSSERSPQRESPPVQGPINREPEEKLYPDLPRRRPSVVRQMFQRLVDSLEPVVVGRRRRSRLLVRMT